MKKQIPVIIMAIISAVLAVALYSAKQQIARLEQQIADLSASQIANAAPSSTATVEAAPASTVKTAEESGSEPKPTPEKEEESANRRLMKNIAKMMDNPTMNKVMEASQRGVVGALYADLIDVLDLNEEETKYFMDLLMFRQMTQADLGMKMMSGTLTAEEKEEESYTERLLQAKKKAWDERKKDEG